MGLPGRERSTDDIVIAVWIQYTNVTDGQQTPDDGKDRERRAVKIHESCQQLLELM